MPLQTYDRPIDYWNERHARFSTARSGGDIGLEEEANQAFYFLRLGLLLRAIERHLAPTDRPLVLDAGCGKGFFADALSRCGYDVQAIDASPVAIEFCRKKRQGAYHVADVADFSSPYLFDVVYCIDVLFHIIPDDSWQQSFRNLASLVSFSGLLAVTGLNLRERLVLGDYIVHRTFDEHLAAARAQDLSFREFLPYDFRGNAIGLYIFQRELL